MSNMVIAAKTEKMYYCRIKDKKHKNASLEINTELTEEH